MRLKRLLRKEQKHFPDDLDVLYTNDISKNVRNKFDIVRVNGIIGLALVLVVLAIFLNIRSSIWVAMGIPFSLLGVLVLIAGLRR